jgi:hypothetical protein
MILGGIQQSVLDSNLREPPLDAFRLVQHRVLIISTINLLKRIISATKNINLSLFKRQMTLFSLLTWSFFFPTFNRPKRENQYAKKKFFLLFLLN